jgi:hypothetical protein
MNVHLYMVDFPQAKHKFWQSSLKNAILTPIASDDMGSKSDFSDQDIYLFYISSKDQMDKINEKFELATTPMFYYGLIFEKQEHLEKLSPKSVLNREKIVLISADTPSLNLGNVHALNHMITYHQKDAHITYKFKNKIQELSNQFDVAIERLEKQLMLARKKFFTKDHSKPIKFNSIQFDYTYRAGSKPGTEYSDFIFWNDWTLWLNFSSTSYSDSSVILKYIEDCRKEKDYWTSPKLQDIFQLLQKNIESFQTVMNQKIDADYFICLINTKQRSADYIFKGSYECYGSKGVPWQGRQDEPMFRRKELSAGEIFLLLTPGIFRNIQNESKKSSVRNFVKTNLDKLKQEILPELYLTLEKDQSNFLDYDMNVVYGEVAQQGKN